jgi:hypothetical protein
MTRTVYELGGTPSEYYDLPSTDDFLDDLSQRGIKNEGEGSVPHKERSGIRESGEVLLCGEDTALCQRDIPPTIELLALTAEDSLLCDGLPSGNTPPSHIGQFTQSLMDNALGTQFSWLQKDPPETDEGELRQFAGMSGYEMQAEVGLSPQSPLSLVEQYLIALQIEYMGSPLDKILEFKAHGHPISLKRTTQDADLDKGLAECIVQDITKNDTGNSEAMTDTPRKKQKNNCRATARVLAQHRAQSYVPPSVTDYGMQSSLSSQASNVIPGTSNERFQSCDSSPPGPKYISTAELPENFFHAAEERDKKQSVFQEELLAEIWKQTAAVEEMVQVVKELYRSARA